MNRLWFENLSPEISPSLDINQGIHIASPPKGRKTSKMSLPPLSLSILGVEPLDEFVLEIANYVHHMIMTRPDLGGSAGDAKVEVEAKVGVLRDRMSGQRLALPVLVETSQYATCFCFQTTKFI